MKMFFVTILTAIISTYEGLILSLMWKWFMVTTFGLPRLSIPAAIGLALIVACLTLRVPEDDKGEDSTLGKYILRGVYACYALTVLLVMAWVTHLFIPR
jgi:hypothetical protein